MSLPAPTGSAFNRTRGAYLATELSVAGTHWSRFLGLMATAANEFSAGRGLWITPSHGVHTLAMRFPIDFGEESWAKLTEAPKLLVEWSSPWEEFRTAIRPALSKSPDPLAGEAQTGLFPVRGMVLSWALQAGLLIAVIVIPSQLSSMRPYEPPAAPKYDVIYYSKDELPRTEDLGGAESGVSGEAGGQEAFHRTQTIKVARGTTLRESVVDAPQLKLPVSNLAVANLLAYQRIPGPPPSEGLTSSLRAPSLNREAVPPPPSLQRD